MSEPITTPELLERLARARLQLIAPAPRTPAIFEGSGDRL